MITTKNNDLDKLKTDDLLQNDHILNCLFKSKSTEGNIFGKNCSKLKKMRAKGCYCDRLSKYLEIKIEKEMENDMKSGKTFLESIARKKGFIKKISMAGKFIAMTKSGIRTNHTEKIEEMMEQMVEDNITDCKSIMSQSNRFIKVNEKRPEDDIGSKCGINFRNSRFSMLAPGQGPYNSMRVVTMKCNRRYSTIEQTQLAREEINKKLKGSIDKSQAAPNFNQMKKLAGNGLDSFRNEIRKVSQMVSMKDTCDKGQRMNGIGDGEFHMIKNMPADKNGSFRKISIVVNEINRIENEGPK